MMLRLALLLAAVPVVFALSAPARAADPAAGEKIFKTQCSVCHTVEKGKNRIGPSLFGVVGRKAGTVDGFHYSKANKDSGITWTPEELNKYLANPRGVVPGTIMTYAGLKNDEQRQNLIAYLDTLH